MFLIDIMSLYKLEQIKDRLVLYNKEKNTFNIWINFTIWKKIKKIIVRKDRQIKETKIIVNKEKITNEKMVLK